MMFSSSCNDEDSGKEVGCSSLASTAPKNRLHRPDPSSITVAADENEDWMATCAIYGDCTESRPLHHMATSVTAASGFSGRVRLAMSTEYTAFFRAVEDQEGYFRYFKLSQPPQLQLQFKYMLPFAGATGTDNEQEDFSSVTPTSVTIQWIHYPQEWPDQDKKPFLAAIWDKANKILRGHDDVDGGGLSFAVCEYCEHLALVEYSAAVSWPIIHQEDPFRLVRLPAMTDSLYHTNHGTKIHVYQEARKLPPSYHSSTQSKSQKAKIIDAKMLVNRPRPATIEEYARQALLDEWKQLYVTDCPICFDTMPYGDGVILPCHHFVCEDCISSLLHFKVQELAMYRTNPFACPVETCRHALPIIGFVKHFLPTEEMDQVRRWIKDMKYPPCFSLDRCLSKLCGAMDCMRRVTKDSTNVYCDQCQKHWCELCLKRLQEDGTEHNSATSSSKGAAQEHTKERCEDTVAWQFCKRYLAASEDQKQACEAKYPWIVSYAHARQHDGDAMTWILQNGQVCPNCAIGVERIEGCFHMQCPTCATHFCYECGDELFPPYYGTHHCWERTQFNL